MTQEMPLEGLRVLDLATVIAGPLSSALLADFGADVVKVELPNGSDGMRALPPFKDGVSLWGKVTNRNKRGVTLDIRKPEGLALFKRMLPKFDVLVENFRPGTLARWGLPLEELHRINPKLTVLRVSGFGQTGPRAHEAGFARVAEATSGLTHICGVVDHSPLHLGYPIADGMTGLFGAFGLMTARSIARRTRNVGREIDLSFMNRCTEYWSSGDRVRSLGAFASGPASANMPCRAAFIARVTTVASLACSTQSVSAWRRRGPRRSDRRPALSDECDRVANSDRKKS